MGAANEEEDEHAHGRLRARCDARVRGNHHQGAVPVTPQVTLFHARDCHLCERARAILAALAEECDFALTEVDIGGDARLEALYREWLPVVEIEGERAFVYTVPADAFRDRVNRARTKSRTNIAD